jgi:hypothetical protein
LHLLGEFDFLFFQRDDCVAELGQILFASVQLLLALSGLRADLLFQFIDMLHVIVLKFRYFILIITAKIINHCYLFFGVSREQIKVQQFGRLNLLLVDDFQLFKFGL